MYIALLALLSTNSYKAKSIDSSYSIDHAVVSSAVLYCTLLCTELYCSKKRFSRTIGCAIQHKIEYNSASYSVRSHLGAVPLTGWEQS